MVDIHLCSPVIANDDLVLSCMRSVIGQMHRIFLCGALSKPDIHLDSPSNASDDCRVVGCLILVFFHSFIHSFIEKDI